MATANDLARELARDSKRTLKHQQVPSHDLEPSWWLMAGVFLVFTGAACGILLAVSWIARQIV